MRRILKTIYKRYLIDAMSAMALGLFASLIIGLIISQLAKIPFLSFLNEYASVVSAASPVVGAAIGVAIANGLKAEKLALYAAGVAGAIGYKLSGALGAYFAAVAAAEAGRFVYGKTRLDILVVPGTAIIAGGIVASLLSPPINEGVKALQAFLERATLLQPIPMGIILSVVFGLVLTAPISSAALAAVVFAPAAGQPLSHGLMLAAGAATVGCCCQMVGFAVASYRENGMAGLISQGLGTSMLQFGNILAHPLIWLPPTLVSALLGPLATTIFQMKNASAAAGMGTSGLVGQAGTLIAMAGENTWWVVGRMLILHILLPAALTLAASEGMRKLGWIRFGDMKLEDARAKQPAPAPVPQAPAAPQ